jgi:steroid delta-isomerase-like uncharacterized protein
MKRESSILGIAVLLVALSIVPAHAARSDNKAVVRGVVEAVNKGNLAAFDELFAPDLVSHGPRVDQTSGREEEKRGVAAILAAFPDAHVTLEDLIADGDKVVARLTFTGTQTGELKSMTMGTIPATGKRVTTTGIYIYRLARGKIVEEWSNLDNLGLLAQFGLLATSLVPKGRP